VNNHEYRAFWTKRNALFYFKIMKNWYLYFLLLFFVSCRMNPPVDETVANIDLAIQKFEIDDYFITFNTLINDTIPANVFFETGARDVFVDIAYFEKYLDTGQEKQPNPFQMFSPYLTSTKDTAYFIKSNPIKIKVGNRFVVFDDFYVIDFKKKNIKGDLFFPISTRDSLTIWEINFDQKYIKLHDYKNITIPCDYVCSQMYKVNNHHSNDILFDIPIQYVLSNQTMCQDTFFCLFDTGNPTDILLWNSLNIIEKIKQQPLSNGIFNSQNVRVFRTVGTFFNSHIKDTISIRFFEKISSTPMFNIAGMNFIVRFNYFIDLHDKKIFHKQISNPVHIYSKDGYDIGGAYAHYDTALNIVIDSIGKKYANDALARSGVRDGDVVIWACGYSVKEQIEKMIDYRDAVHDYGGYHYKVIRNGDTLDLKTRKTF
jgi:hypothetical protein